MREVQRQIVLRMISAPYSERKEGILKNTKLSGHSLEKRNVLINDQSEAVL
jgi:hypothetical protein